MQTSNYHFYRSPQQISNAIGNSTVTYTTIFAQRSGVSRTLWVPLEPMLNVHFSSRYSAVLCSTDQHDFTFIGEIRCHTNA